MKPQHFAKTKKNSENTNYVFLLLPFECLKFFWRYTCQKYSRYPLCQKQKLRKTNTIFSTFCLPRKCMRFRKSFQRKYSAPENFERKVSIQHFNFFFFKFSYRKITFVLWVYFKPYGRRWLGRSRLVFWRRQTLYSVYDAFTNLAFWCLLYTNKITSTFSKVFFSRKQLQKLEFQRKSWIWRQNLLKIFQKRKFQELSW